jgi:hypothetical protein
MLLSVAGRSINPMFVMAVVIVARTFLQTKKLRKNKSAALIYIFGIL